MNDSITIRTIRNGVGAALLVAGVWTPCRANPPGDPEGACCLPDASCIVATASRCRAQGGTYQGDGVACDDANCPIFGACCIPFDVCETTTIQECFGNLGGVIWAPGQNCGTYTCQPLGACCRPDGTCQVTRQSSCEVTLGGTYQGDGVACRIVSCPRPCPADITGNEHVDFADLLDLLAAWGSCFDCPEDIDGDGIVGFADLLVVLAGWGPCP